MKSRVRRLYGNEGVAIEPIKSQCKAWNVGNTPLDMCGVVREHDRGRMTVTYAYTGDSINTASPGLTIQSTAYHRLSA
jgi:hypothetical protein